MLKQRDRQTDRRTDIEREEREKERDREEDRERERQRQTQRQSNLHLKTATTKGADVCSDFLLHSSKLSINAESVPDCSSCYSSLLQVKYFDSN